MKIFIDTEFTDLIKDTTLISIGIITEDNKSFYGEFDDYDRKQVTEFVEDNVICNLLHNNEDAWNNLKSLKVYGNKTKIRNGIIDLLYPYKAKKETIEIVSDCPCYDMVLFNDIFGGSLNLPSYISPVCHDINQDIASYLNISETEAFNLSREEFVINYLGLKLPEIEGLLDPKHNSLYDAYVIKIIYENINAKHPARVPSDTIVNTDGEIISSDGRMFTIIDN